MELWRLIDLGSAIVEIGAEREGVIWKAMRMAGKRLGKFMLSEGPCEWSKKDRRNSQSTCRMGEISNPNGDL